METLQKTINQLNTLTLNTEVKSKPKTQVRTVALVYDTHSVDSVISAAMLKTYLEYDNIRLNKTDTLVFAVSADSALPTDVDSYHFVGATLDKKIQRDLTKQQIEIVTHAPCYNAVVPTPNTYFTAVCKYMKRELIHEYWRVTQLIERFSNLDRFISLNDQAVLLANWKEANRCLNSPTPFHVTEQPALKEFHQQLDYLKGNLRKISTNVLCVDKRHHEKNVPVFVTSGDLVPWVVKLASIYHDELVVCDNKPNRRVWSYYCADMHQERNLSKLIKKLASDDSMLCFSSHLSRV